MKKIFSLSLFAFFISLSALAAEEVRALWVVRNTLTSPEKITAMVERAAKNGFNTLIVQVRGRGDALYRSRWEPRSDLLKDQPASFDPLAQVLREAHARGLKVHAWINTHFLSNVDEPPIAADHVYNAHPDWLMIHRGVAKELWSMNPRDPSFREKLSKQISQDRSQIEGLYLSPAHPAVKEHLQSIWLDLLESYDIDGLHFDYVRYPAPMFDFNKVSLEKFRAEIEKTLSPGERRLLATVAQTDPLVYATVFPERWEQFKRDQITDLVERIYFAVKKRKPSVVVSAAVFADDEDAFARRFQDWKLWLERGILDVVCPMAYTPDTETFKRQIARARTFSLGKQLWAGIGAYQQPFESTMEKIDAARQLGADGVAFFSYDSMIRESAANPKADYLEKLKEGLSRSVGSN